MEFSLNSIGSAFGRTKVLDIVTHPNKLLSQKSEEVDIANDATLAILSRDMIKTMHAFEGVGLAGIQVGILKKILVYDISPDGDSACVLLNPVIIESSQECEPNEEGCLSFPNVYFPVTRPLRVTVKGFDENGLPVLIENAEGILSRVLQHEIDHLNGVMIADRAKPHIRKKALQAFATYDKLEPGTVVTITDSQEQT